MTSLHSTHILACVQVANWLVEVYIEGDPLIGGHSSPIFIPLTPSGTQGGNSSAVADLDNQNSAFWSLEVEDVEKEKVMKAM